MKAIIFDFDGVIHDTFQFHKNKIKEFSNIEISSKDFRDIHNGNFFNNSNKCNILKNIDWFIYKDFIYHDFSNMKISNEIREVLIKLSKKYSLFIISSGGQKNIIDYLGNNNIISIFKEVLGAEFHFSKVEKFNYIFKKYKLCYKECLFITDTLGDIIEANCVKIKTIAVDFGYHDKEILLLGNPFKIISNFEELLFLIK